MRLSRSIAALAIFALVCCAAAAASCHPADPAGYYEGTAQSKEAGSLRVAMNLRCDNGTYTGNIVTPVGTFAITDGAYVNGVLTVQFGGGAIGDRGTLTLQVSGNTAVGSFKLAADSGAFTLTRMSDARIVASTTPDLNIMKQQWRDDLKFLVQELTTKHVNPFAFTPRQSLLNEASALDRQIDTLNADQIYVGMDHIANLIGDGHTYVEFPPDLALFPVLFQRFGDDYRTVEATGSYWRYRVEFYWF